MPYNLTGKKYLFLLAFVLFVKCVAPSTSNDDGLGLKNVYSTTDKPHEGVLFGTVQPLLDISAAADQKFLEKYGLESNNQIMADPVRHANLFEDFIQWVLG